MDFEEFEGFKKIPNTNNMTLENILNILKNYEDNIGRLTIFDQSETPYLLIDVDGKYNIDIRLRNNDIIIERKLEDGQSEDEKDGFDNSKSVTVAHCDRIIEQIYDLLNDYIDDGEITEHITSAQKVLCLSQQSSIGVFDKIPLGDKFIVTEYNNKNGVLYNVKQNSLLSTYVVTDVKTKREIFNLKYKKDNTNEYIITKQPFQIFDIYRDKESVKTLFRSDVDGRPLKISADYSNNHYLIELNEIVIGSVDCLDAELKRNYRLEINDLYYEDLIIAAAIIMDNIGFTND